MAKEIEVDGKKAELVEHEQVVLTECNLEELVHTLAKKQKQIVDQGKVYSAAGTKLNELKKSKELIMAEIIKRDPVGRQLAFEQEQGDVTNDKAVDTGEASIEVPKHPAGDELAKKRGEK